MPTKPESAGQGFEALPFEELTGRYPGQVLPFGDKLPRVSPTAHLFPGAVITGDVRLHPGAVLLCHVAARGDINYIEVGENSNIQDGTVLHVADEWPCIVADHVTVGHRAIVHGARVERGALIGMGAILLNGVVVGEEAIVAAGAVVREGFRVPPRTLVAGIPARVVRELTEEETRLGRELALKYQRVVRVYLGAGQKPTGQEV